MIKQLLAALLCLLALTACGSKTSPSRVNDITPLTSMQIVTTANASIANGTSVPVQVIGNFSGLFTRDITSEVTITSSAPAIADFTVTGLPTRIKGAATGTTTISATSAKWGLTATAPLTIKNLTVSFLAITPFNPSIPKGDPQQLTVTGTFSDNSTQDLTIDATWNSTTPGVATVGDTIATKGLVQTVELGQTNISATMVDLGGASNFTKVTVIPPAVKSIAIKQGQMTLLSIAFTNYSAIATYSDGTTGNITSLAAWTTSPSTVATVDSGTATAGKAFTLASGTTQIKASLSGIDGITTLKVTGGKLIGLNVTPSTPLPLIKGNSLRVSAVGTFDNNTTRDITGALKWTSPNSGLVNLTGPTGSLLWFNGIATTAIPVNVTGTFGTTQTTTAVTVTAPSLNANGLIISATPADLTVGAGVRLTVTGAFSDGTSQDLTNTATWSTPDTTVLSVGDSFANRTKGRVTALTASNTPVTVIASYSGQQATATITTITNRTLNTIAVSGVTGTLTAGNQVTAKVTATYSDGKTEDVTEGSSITIDKKNIATLVDTASLPGAIVGVDTGTATLTATFNGKTATQTITVQ